MVPLAMDSHGALTGLERLANRAVADLYDSTGHRSNPSRQNQTGWFDGSRVWLVSVVHMILCTLLAGGGVFWAGEPIAHFVSLPPYFASTDSAQDWQFKCQSICTDLAWSILGSLTTIILMKLHYEKGHPLAPRTLVPMFGEAVLSIMGVLADACCIIVVVAYTVGPIGSGSSSGLRTGSVV